MFVFNLWVLGILVMAWFATWLMGDQPEDFRHAGWKNWFLPASATLFCWLCFQLLIWPLYLLSN